MMMSFDDGSGMAAVRANGTSPSRNYVVLERQEFDAAHGEAAESYFIEVHQVEARNADNALRQAFKEMRAGGYEPLEAVLVVIPESMWRTTTVHANVRESVSLGR